MISDEKRKAFEQWYKSLFGADVDMLRDVRNPDMYHFLIHQAAWMAWQAARQTKKLIWAKSGDEWVANTGFGVYIIRQNKDGYWDVYLDNGISELWLITKVLVTLDDAVAFANADFHERVLGCLVNGVGDAHL